MHEVKTPLIRLAKRDAMPAWQVWCIRGSSFIAAILLGALIFLVLGNNPISAYGTILSGSLGKSTAIRQTVKIAIPLLGTALAIAPCFKMRFWNIGAEGQITAGAVAASYFALFWADRLPGPALILVMAAAGAVAGGIWALVPAFFKAKWGTNETLFTLMMNYIIIGVVRWLQGGPWEGRPGSQIIPQFDSKAVLPKVLGVHCGWIIVLVLTVVMFIYMKYTKQGYEIAVIGESENTARYAGMNVGAIIMRTMFLSGAIAGIAGVCQVGGSDMTLSMGVAGGGRLFCRHVCGSVSSERGGRPAARQHVCDAAIVHAGTVLRPCPKQHGPLPRRSRYGSLGISAAPLVHRAGARRGEGAGAARASGRKRPGPFRGRRAGQLCAGLLCAMGGRTPCTRQNAAHGARLA